MTILGPIAMGFVVALVLTPVLRWLGHRHELLDQPNDRSSHVRPTPRAGGVAILAGVAASVAVFGEWGASRVAPMLGLAGVIAVVGLLDDILSLRAIAKLVVQLVVAIASTVLLGALLPGIGIAGVGALVFPFWLGAGLSVFWIVGVTNAYNFMDGVNGIASIEAIVCGLAYAVLFASHGDPAVAALCLGVAGAALGFLVFNATGTIFMGDVGSATLGFLFGVLALRLTELGVSFLAAALPLLPFLLDTATTLLRRARRRERLFTAHRTHAYQRLTDLGWSHMTVSASYGLLGSTCSLLAITWESLPPSVAVSAFLFLSVLLVVGLQVVEAAVGRRQA